MMMNNDNYNFLTMMFIVMIMILAMMKITVAMIEVTENVNV